MKKNIACVAAGLSFVSAGAFAQSSVVLYGTLDEGINYTSNANGKSAWQMSSVAIVTSNWGLKGSEDLGGGLHAIFNLSSGINVESGTAAYDGRLFGYQSYVGLQDDKIGTVTLGRQFDPVMDLIGPLTANSSWGGYLFSHPLDNDNTDGTWHADNSVKFTSAAYGGLSGSALYGFSNQAGNFAQNRVYAVGLNYTHATLTAAAVYEDLSSPGSTAGGSIASDDSGFAAAGQKIWGLGVNYGVGPVTLGLVYMHTNVYQTSSSVYVGDIGAGRPDLHFDNIELNVRYDVNPAFFVGGMYTYTRAGVKTGTGASVLHWNQAGLMAQYNFSKRTAVYAQAVYQALSGGGTGTPLDNAFIPGAAGISSNANQVVARVAIMHSF